MTEKQTIVLTGASGVVGSALLTELRDRSNLIGLVHRGTLADPAVESIRCDITEPNLGLSDAAHRELAARADAIIHSAALTDWAAPKESLWKVNVGGAEHMLEFARAAQAPLYHVSTAFIQALSTRAPLELEPSNVIVNYVQSKIECEALVANSGIPHTIIRPTNLLGDSKTGAIARSQAVQLVSEFICRGKLPIVPARPNTLVDVLPQDLVAKAIAAVVDAEALGQRLWLTAGADAMTIHEVISYCEALAERIGRPIATPRIIHPEQIDPGEIEALPPMSRRFFHHVCQFSDGLTACGEFPSSLEAMHASYPELPRLSSRDAYVRGLEYWAISKGLWNRPGA